MASLRKILLLLFFLPAIAPAADLACGTHFDLLTYQGDEVPADIDLLEKFESSYFTVRDNKGAKFIADWNNKLNQALHALPHAAREPNRLAGLNPAQMQALMDKLQSNEVTRIGHLCRYNYKPGSLKGWGFCFGRAMAAHLYALAMGVDKTQIRKVWAVGPMKTGESWWRFHVATMVRGTDGKWWALDPLTNSKPVLMESWQRSMEVRNRQWIQRLEGERDLHQVVPPDYYDQGSVMFFSSEAKRLWAYSNDTYNSTFAGEPGIDIFKPKFNGYFRDFMRSLREEMRAIMKEIPPPPPLLLPAPRP